VKTALLLADAAQRLKRAGIDSGRLDARLLLRHAISADERDDGLMPEEIDGEARDRFQVLLARRLAREPVAYVVGIKEFWSLEFEVGKGALVPRPESELLIETLGKLFPDRARALGMLDLGVGTGCLLLSALSEFPNARGVGIERSLEAMHWARLNAAKLDLEARAEFRLADWRSGIAGSYDVILANPPYVATGELAALEPEVLRYEPLGALDGGRDGLESYRDLSSVLASLLSPRGLAFLEVGAGQSEGVAAILMGKGLRVEQIMPDLAGIPRCIVARRGEP
jgi:release factor glutamine methyltransferase